MEIMVFEDVDMACRALARRVVRLAESGGTIALSGGSTPKRLFSILTAEFSDVDWAKVHFFWGDERCVGAESLDSNYGVAKNLFFDPCGVAVESIHPVNGLNDPELEAVEYAKEIGRFCNHENGVPVFDLIVLGVGEDGHTASLFLDRPELWLSDEVCVAVKHPVSGQERVSISGSVINGARQVVFLCCGESKVDVVSKVINEMDSSLPAGKVCPIDGSLTWFLDKAAAKKLK